MQRTPITKVGIGILFLSLLAQLLSAQPPVLARGRVGGTEVLIGDHVFLQLQISAPAGTEILRISADSVASSEQLEILEARDSFITAEEPELLVQKQYRLITFDTGSVRIPPLQVVFRNLNGQLDTTYSQSIYLEVGGMPVTEESELQPIKPIIEEGFYWTDLWWLYLLLLVLLLAVVAYSYWRRRAKQQRPIPPPPPVPPHERALQRLTELEAQELWQQGALKQYHSELTHILRTYIGAIFHLPALEFTTRELDAAIEKRGLLNRQQRQELLELLQVADLVKFAKAEPPRDLHARALEQVRAFVEATQPATAPEESETES